MSLIFGMVFSIALVGTLGLVYGLIMRYMRLTEEEGRRIREEKRMRWRKKMEMFEGEESE